MKIFASFVAAVAAVILAAPVAAPSTLAAPMSFRQVRDRVYAEPLATPPRYTNLSIGDLFEIVFGAIHGALGDRSRATISDASDFKPRAPKILHPMGVCADADWSITASSGATGLLADGARARAIVRMSTGSPQVDWAPGGARQFGLAIKLFPTQDPNAPVTSRNVFTLDQTGLDGSPRASYLMGDSPADAVYFRNIALGSLFASRRLTALFANFDWHPEHRPLYPLTEISDEDDAIENPITPWEIRFVPHVTSKIAAFSKDFRTELAAARPGQIYFDIVIPAQKGFGAPGQGDQLVGRLTIGQPVMSIACDQELHFHHHPNRRSLSASD